MLRRRLTGFEADMAKETVQLAVLMRNEADAKMVVELMQEGVVGTRLKLENGEMVFDRSSGRIGELRMGIDTPREACQFVAGQSLDGRFAKVFRSGNLVALNSVHSVADGGFVKNLLARIDKGKVERCDEMPATLEMLFKDRIEAVRSDALEFPDDDKLSRLPISRRPVSIAESARYVTIEDYASNFLCYDKVKGAPRGLTDAYWTAMILAAASMRKDSGFFRNVGVNNCVDLRSYLPQEKARSLNVCNMFTIVNAVASIEDQSAPIKEIGKRIRSDLTRKLDADGVWESVKTCYRGFPRGPILNSVLQLSNVGPIRCDRAEDFWAQQFVKSIYCEFGLSMLSFSRITNNRNVIVSRLRYAPTVCPDDYAVTYANRVLKVLTEVPDDTPIKDAVAYLSTKSSYIK